MSTLKVDAIRHNSATSDAITTAADGTCIANITNNLSNRNKVINGGMMIHQRGDASATGSAAYLSCDRFKTNNGSGAQVAVTKSTDTPDGFGASTKWDCTTADTSVAASDFFLIQHRLEGQNIQDFAKVDLRIARVKQALEVPAADKLVQLILDVGELGEKKVFAGIKKAYKIEELNDKLVVLVNNLAPREMSFGLSEGMILAAGPGGEDIFMISPDIGAEPGMRVK